MGIVNHVPDPAQGAIVDAANQISLPDDNENMKADNIRLGDEQIADWIVFLVKGPANDIDFKITGNGTPPLAGYTPTVRAIDILGAFGLKVTAPLQVANLTTSLPMNGAQPTSSANPGENTAHSTNISKAWATITTDGAGNATVQDGLNIASLAVVADTGPLNPGYVEVTFTRAFANANYAPVVTCQGGGLSMIVGSVASSPKTTTAMRVYFWDVQGGATVDPDAKALTFWTDVKGRH